MDVIIKFSDSFVIISDFIKRTISMSRIIDIIASETNGKSYKSRKYAYDGSDVLSDPYDDHREITWKKYGETVPPKSSKNMKVIADGLMGSEPLFTYFLDGSRHTYKVDDIAYRNKVFPIIAGQIGISCCKRVNKNMQKHEFNGLLVIALPKTARKSDWDKGFSFNSLRDKLNNDPWLIKNGISFDRIISYKTTIDEFERIENKGIAAIHDVMIQSEIEMVSRLVSTHKINAKHYLLKDGSLEFNVNHISNDRELRMFRNNFSHVVGVSKSFNPENCVDRNGRNNSDVVVNLPLYHRTPVSMYDSPRLEGMKYAVWYLRIRDKKYTTNAFDGILKIEKILVSEAELQNGIDTEEVDYISANLVNERNPVCYGADHRWANHLYPVYVTERYAKSRYLSDAMFLNLF